MSKRVKGFDKLMNSLDKLQDNADKLDGSHNVDFQELFSEDFLKKHTNSSDIYEFIESSNLNVKDQDSFNEIVLTDEWNSYVKSSTNFPSWDKMQEQATSDYISKKLFGNL